MLITFLDDWLIFIATGETVFSAVFTFNIDGKPTEKDAIKAEMATAVSIIQSTLEYL